MQVQTQGKQFYMWFNRLFSHDFSEIRRAGGRIVDRCSSPTLHLCLLRQNQDKLSTHCSLCGSVSILSPKFPIDFNLHLGLSWPMSTATSLVLSFGYVIQHRVWAAESGLVGHLFLIKKKVPLCCMMSCCGLEVFLYCLCFVGIFSCTHLCL